jgi:hypothetical protein
MRICWGFHRPMRIHFAAIGTLHRPRKLAAPNTTDRR